MDRNAEATISSPPNMFWASCPADERRQRAAASTPSRRSRALSIAGRSTLRRWPQPMPRSSRRPGSRSRSTAGCSSGGSGQHGDTPRRACCPASASGVASPWRRSPRWRSISRCPSSIRRRSKRHRRGWSPRLPPRQRRPLSRGLRRPHRRHRPVSCGGRARPGRDFELWVIEGQQAPVSLGVIPAGDSARLPVSRALRAKMVSGALFAISVEPAGGSPPAADRTGRRCRRSEGDLTPAGTGFEFTSERTARYQAGRFIFSRCSKVHRAYG